MKDRLASMDFSTQGEQGEVVVVAVAGDVDSSNAADLRRAIYERVSPGATVLVVDLSETAYLDSAGVELIFELARRLTARRQALRIVAVPGGGVRRVLELCAVGAVADLAASLDEAYALN